jgi:predicted RNA binding protein with dsRBD fold (UPF0201 family)
MITISTPVFATENPEKILKVLEAKFPGCKFQKSKNQISGTCQNISCLSEIKRKVEDGRIANTVRYLVLEHNKIELNKQALIKGRINFVEENYPLGNVVIEFENEKEILNYLAPSTI